MVDEAPAGGVDRRQLQLLLGAEVGEQAALAHAQLGRQAPDRQALEPFDGGQVGGRLQDRLARAVAAPAAAVGLVDRLGVGLARASRGLRRPFGEESSTIVRTVIQSTIDRAFFSAERRWAMTAIAVPRRAPNVLAVAAGAAFLALLDTTVANLAVADVRTDFAGASRQRRDLDHHDLRGDVRRVPRARGPRGRRRRAENAPSRGRRRLHAAVACCARSRRRSRRCSSPARCRAPRRRR